MHSLSGVHAEVTQAISIRPKIVFMASKRWSHSAYCIPLTSYLPLLQIHQHHIEVPIRFHPVIGARGDTARISNLDLDSLFSHHNDASARRHPADFPLVMVVIPAVGFKMQKLHEWLPVLLSQKFEKSEGRLFPLQRLALNRLVNKV